MENKKKICFIISNIDRWIPFEWIYSYLSEKEFQQSYILLTSERGTYFYKFLVENGCLVRHIPFKGKRNYLSSWLKINTHLKSFRPDIVHCHFLDASLIGLSASYLSNVPVRIYTRHHGFFHHKYHPKGVWIDKVCNKLATKVVAISKIVAEVLYEERVKPDKVKVIHHGFKLGEFKNVPKDRIDDAGRMYNSKNKSPVIGVIARHIELKGIQYIIPAFKKFLMHFPNAFLILANARGSYHGDLINLLENNISKENYILIPFEMDIPALYKIFDVYVHVPIDEKIEAFGQTYVEALAAGIPSIFTKSGIANDFIEDEKNALVVSFKDSGAIFKAMLRIMQDKKLTSTIINNGQKDVKELFTFEQMAGKLIELYCK